LIFEGDLIRLVIKGELIHQGVVEWHNVRGEWSGTWQVTDYRPNIYPRKRFFSSWWEIYGNVHVEEIEK
jgi:hypothetical protein